MMKVKFKQWDCVVEFAKYDNGRIAIILNDANDYSRVAVATVNIPEHPLRQDQVLIKDYSENKGIYSALFDAGLVERTRTMVRTGRVEAIECNLKVKTCPSSP